MIAQLKMLGLTSKPPRRKCMLKQNWAREESRVVLRRNKR